MNIRLTMRVVLKRFCFIGFGFFCVILLLFAGLIFTHVGNQLTLSIVQNIEPRLSIKLDQGSFFSSPHYSDIHWIDQQTSIDIVSASYQFDWSCLFNKICIKSLDITDGEVMFANKNISSESKPEKTTLSKIELPIAIDLQAINLTNIHLSASDIDLSIDSLHIQVQGKKSEINLQSMIDGLSVTLAQKPHEKSIANRNALTTLPALLSAQNLPEINLPLNLVASPFKISNFTLIQSNEKILSVNSLTTSFDFKHSQLSIHSLKIDAPETDLQLNGKINFTKKYPLDLHLQGQLKKLNQLSPETLLLGQIYDINLTGDLSQLKTELLLSNKISMKLSVQINLMEDNLPYDLRVNWHDFSWPLKGKTQYSSLLGELHSYGSVNNYQVTLKGRYDGNKIPAGDIVLKGDGNLQQFNLQQLLIKTLDGSATLSGLLKWPDVITWGGQLLINNIDLAKLNTPYQGSFSGLIKQNMQFMPTQLKSPSWKVSFPEININGQFLKHPFLVHGGLSIDSENGIFFQDITVKNANNSVIVDGRLAQQSKLSIKLDIADLSNSLLASSGTLQGHVNIRGEKDNLKVNASLHGRLLSYQAIKLDDFVLESAAIISDNPSLTLQLTAQKMVIANQVIDSIAINIKNVNGLKNATVHHIESSIKSKLLTSKFQLTVSEKENTWLTKLMASTLYLQNQTIMLKKPIDIFIKQSQAFISPHCWIVGAADKQDGGKICINKLTLGNKGEAEIAIKSYLLANFEPFLANTYNLSGTVSADAQVKWNATTKPVYWFDVFTQNAQLYINLDKNKKNRLIYPLDTVELKVKSDNAKSELSLKLSAKNLIDAQIQGQLFPYKENPTINLKAKIGLPNFLPFSQLVPEFGEIIGHSNINLTLTGPLSKPLINGDIKVADVEVLATGMPVHIQRLNTVVSIKNNKAKFDGEFYTAGIDQKSDYGPRKTIVSNAISLVDQSIKKVTKTFIDKAVPNDNLKRQVAKDIPGKARIYGTFNWQDKVTANIHLSAKQLTINDYDKIYLLVSPELHLNIAKEITLNGNVFVDKGKITVKELPASAISVSKDIVVIDRKAPLKNTILPLIVNLKVAFGELLKVDALGLDTTIKGNLRIEKFNDKAVNIQGSLKLINGSYRAFSQQLVLQKSLIIFQGAASTPYISIEAIRDPNKVEDDVIAGVRVTGTPEQLSMVVFSEPVMAQQDALSYIIRGKSLQNSNESEGNSQMIATLISLGANQSADVINKIGNNIGIKDLSLSSRGSGEQQSVGVSGYISPGVELSYGVGVFNSFSIFAIRYQLFDDFYIEASSGLQQAIDAYYQFEWD